MSHVTCHVSHGTCHMSCVTCNMSQFFIIIFFLDKVVKLIGGGSVIGRGSVIGGGSVSPAKRNT